MQNQRKQSTAVLTIFLVLLVSGVALVTYLQDRTPATPSAPVATTNQTTEPSSQPAQSAVASSESQSVNPLVNVPPEVSSHTAHAISEQEVQTLISAIQPTNYQDNLLASQNSIVDAIDNNKLDPAELGYLFLPNHPAQNNQITNAKQLDVPLLLQKDPRWRKTPYGESPIGQLGENGCAILSLAMVHSYYNPSENVTPQTILDWSKETYYLNGQGTSWNIFYDFAQTFGYRFENFGDNFDAAMNAVNNGRVLIASVKPGLFTDFGHILVIRGYDNGQVYVNDPNDDPTKMFSISAIPAQTLIEEGANYWAIYK